jgi:uncharacterized phage-associated protein
MTDAKPTLAINSAIGVANWFIGKNRENPSGLTHLKLQKMLYFAQGWHLAYFDVPLFEDPIEAWKYGPVVRTVWRALSGMKTEELMEPIEGYVLRGTDYEAIGRPEMSFADDDVKDLMESCWNTYSVQSAWELVATTHAKGSPWDKVANSPGNRAAGTDKEWFGEYDDLLIPVELMRSYFKSFLTEDD